MNLYICEAGGKIICGNTWFALKLLAVQLKKETWKKKELRSQGREFFPYLQGWLSVNYLIYINFDKNKKQHVDYLLYSRPPSPLSAQLTLALQNTQPQIVFFLALPVPLPQTTNPAHLLIHDLLNL